jgi:hypothetical protein
MFRFRTSYVAFCCSSAAPRDSFMAMKETSSRRAERQHGLVDHAPVLTAVGLVKGNVICEEELLDDMVNGEAGDQLRAAEALVGVGAGPTTSALHPLFYGGCAVVRLPHGYRHRVGHQLQHDRAREASCHQCSRRGRPDSRP